MSCQDTVKDVCLGAGGRENYYYGHEKLKLLNFRQGSLHFAHFILLFNGMYYNVGWVFSIFLYLCPLTLCILDTPKQVL